MSANHAFLKAIIPFTVDSEISVLYCDDEYRITDLDIKLDSELNPAFPVIRADVVYVNDIIFLDADDPEPAIPDSDGAIAKIMNNVLKNVIDSSDVRLCLSSCVEQNRGLIRANGLIFIHTFTTDSRKAAIGGEKIRTAKSQLKGLRECLSMFIDTNSNPDQSSPGWKLFYTAKTYLVPIKLMRILAPIMHMFASYEGRFFPITGISMNRTIKDVTFTAMEKRYVPLKNGISVIPINTNTLTLDARYLTVTAFAQLHSRSWGARPLKNVTTLRVNYKTLGSDKIHPCFGLRMMNLLALGHGNCSVHTVLIDDNVLDLETGIRALVVGGNNIEDADILNIDIDAPSYKWRADFTISTTSGDPIFANGCFVGKYTKHFGYLFAPHMSITARSMSDDCYTSAVPIKDVVYPLHALIGYNEKIANGTCTFLDDSDSEEQD